MRQNSVVMMLVMDCLRQKYSTVYTYTIYKNCLKFASGHQVSDFCMFAPHLFFSAFFDLQQFFPAKHMLNFQLFFGAPENTRYFKKDITLGKTRCCNLCFLQEMPEVI